MTTEIAPIRLEAAEIDLVKRTIAVGASDEELKLFLFDCRRQGVHPLDKLIHFSKRGGKYTPITSIDFMRMRAADTSEHAGSDDPVYDQPEGTGKPILWAKVTVYRLVQGQRCAFTATARWFEYYPGKGQGFLWDKMPRLMLGKCAEALALRKAFPKQLHGIYEQAELMQAGVEERPLPPTEITADAPVDAGPSLFSNPEADERAELIRQLETVNPSKIKIGLHRVLSVDPESDWRKLDTAALATLAKHVRLARPFDPK